MLRQIAMLRFKDVAFANAFIPPHRERGAGPLQRRWLGRDRATPFL